MKNSCLKIGNSWTRRPLLAVCVASIGLGFVTAAALAAYFQCVAQLPNPVVTQAKCGPLDNPRVCTFKRWSSSNQYFVPIDGPQMCAKSSNPNAQCNPGSSEACYSQTTTAECLASGCPPLWSLSWPDTWQSDNVSRASGTSCN